jgi:hypothetical protein
VLRVVASRAISLRSERYADRSDSTHFRRTRYALINSELAARHADDVDAYYSVRDPVCDLIMDSAEMWAKDQSWQLPQRMPETDPGRGEAFHRYLLRERRRAPKRT